MSDPNRMRPSDEQSFKRDLNPDQFHQPTDANMDTALQHKDVHQRMQRLSDDELRRIPVLKPGTRLQQGAVYMDLLAEKCAEFKAMGGETADKDHLYVPKNETDYVLWNRLLGIDNPARLDEAERGS